MPLQGVVEGVVQAVADVAFEVAAEAAAESAGEALHPQPLPSRRRMITRIVVLAVLALSTGFGLAVIVAAPSSLLAFAGGSLVGLFLVFLLYSIYRDVRRLAG